MLAKASEALPGWLASLASTVMPFHEATSGSASKSTELISLAPSTSRWPPWTLIAAPCEKICTGPWLASILRVTSGGTTIASHGGTVGSALFVLLTGRLYGLAVPGYGLLVAVQVAVVGSLRSVAMVPQGTVVGSTLVASAWPFGGTRSTPPAVSTTAATPTATPYFQAARSRRLGGEAGSWSRRSTSSLTPSLGTESFRPQAVSRLQRRV